MWKKILTGFLILLFVAALFLWFIWTRLTVGSTETITAEVGIEELYQTRCGVCHGSDHTEAPRLASLKLLTADAIVHTLQHGVMQNQAATLSDDQQVALAAYISEVKSDDLSTTDFSKGRCAEETSSKDLTALPHVDNWGLGLKNQRYYDEDDLEFTAANVSELELDWAFAFPNSSRARVQPTVTGTTLYTASQTGTIYALDRYTGCVRWTYQADAEVRSALVIGRDSSGRANRIRTAFYGRQKSMIMSWRRSRVR